MEAGGSAGSEHGPVEPGRLRWYHLTGFRVVVGIIVVVLVVAWRAGTFDHALYNVGLNAKPCARNGFGAVFCGSELTEYREHIESAKREGTEASEKIEREASESDAKVQREIKAEQEHAEEPAPAESG